MKFRTTVQLEGKAATGLLVPDDVVTRLDSGRNPLAPASYVAPSEYTHSEQTLREIDLEVNPLTTSPFLTSP